MIWFADSYVNLIVLENLTNKLKNSVDFTHDNFFNMYLFLSKGKITLNFSTFLITYVYF